jgi:hypothetical protein
MPENGLTITHKGEYCDIDLTERDAKLISELADVMEHAPRDPERPAYPDFTDEELQENKRRFDKHEQLGADFQVQLKRIANLDMLHMRSLMGYLDLIELGDLDGSQSNWALEFIELLLHEVIRHGAAGALHQDPRPFFSSLSHFITNYWIWVRDNREAQDRHPEIFPAPSTTGKPAKPGRARKAHKAA